MLNAICHNCFEFFEFVFPGYWNFEKKILVSAPVP